MKKFTLSFFIFHFSFFTFHLSEAQILRVPAEYPTIQAGVDAAGYGDTVLVAPGTYLENIRIEGNAKVITLAGNFIFSGDTNDINNTIIDASQPQNPNYGMAIFLKNQDTTLMPKITGFTITGGTGYYKTYGGGIYSGNAIPIIEYNHIQNCSVTGTQPNGGGIRISGATPYSICIISHNVIKNCTITSSPTGVQATGAGISIDNVIAVIEDNKITDNHIIGNLTCNAMGGGIYYSSIIPVSFAPQLNILNNEITNNTIESMNADGGGMVLFGYTQYIIEGNTISHNEITALSGSGYGIGGGMDMYNPGDGTVISSNIISDNGVINGAPDADCAGGGISIIRNPSQDPVIYPLIEKNRITGNTAFNGAGIACHTTGARIVNNFISGNQAEMHGGAIYFKGSSDTSTVTQIINNTITSNAVTGQGGEAGGLYYFRINNILLMNNIFYGNQAETTDEIKNTLGTIVIYNCDINPDEINGTWTGENNFYADPQFIDEMTWDCFNADAPCSETGIDQVYAFDQMIEAPVESISDEIMRPQDDFNDVGACEVKMCFVGVPEVRSSQFTVSSYPNPTEGIVDFRFSIFDAGRVTLKIFDMQGREMAAVLDEDKAVGEHTIRWNAEGMPAGIYYYSLRTGKEVQSGEIIIL